jgi:uncharacterized membrane-anchored protein
VTRIFVLIVALAQFAVLAFIAGQREWVARTGRTIYLRTAPIDPSDPMRGDYVQLNYEIALVPRALCQGSVASWCGQNQYQAGYRDQRGYRDRRVYAELKLNPDGLAELVSLSDAPPATGTYLRGRVDWPSWNPGMIHVRYGIEALFVEEGRAQAFESTRRAEQAGVPLDMEVAVGANGLAVLKGYHWEPLGLVLTVDRPPRPGRTNQMTNQPRFPLPRRPGIMGATLELKNHSDHPIAILTHSFRLVGNQQRGSIHYRWVGEDVAPAKPAAEEVKVLLAGESYQVHLDFSLPEWFVTDTAKPKDAEIPVALGTMAGAWDASFRIEYAPPSAEDCAGLPDANLIWHNTLSSRAFGTGGVD